MKKQGLQTLAIALALAIVFSVIAPPMAVAQVGEELSQAANASNAGPEYYGEIEEPDLDTPTPEEMREYALNQIEDAAEAIEEVRVDLKELKIAIPEVVDLLTQAEAQLGEAKRAFKENNYGSSFVYAQRAKSLTENAEEMLDRLEEIKDWEIEVEIEYRNAHVEVELGEIEMEFALDTANKETIIQEIMARAGLDRFTVEKITVFEFDDDVIEKTEELVYELQELLHELGEVYLEIFEEIDETTVVIDEGSQELMYIVRALGMLGIAPEIREALFNKLFYALDSADQTRLSIHEGRVIQANGLVSEVIFHLEAFITRVEAHRDKIGEDDAEMMIERAKEVIEDTEDWRTEIRGLIEELEEILIELDEVTAEIERIVSELEALGAELEVTVEAQENPLITTTITAGGIIVKEAAVCVTALKLEKPAIVFWVGKLKIETLRHFEIEMTLDKIISQLIFPHTTGKLALVGGEPLLGRIINEGMSGGITEHTMALFTALIAVESEVFRFEDELIQVWGLHLVDTQVIHKVTNAPGMHEWRWHDGDFGWAHELPPSALRVTSPRLSIRAFDVDWGPGRGWWWGYWEHNRVYADGHYIGTMTGTPPQRWNNEWSISILDIPCHLVQDGHLDIWVNIDSRHSERTWVVYIDWSIL